MVNSTLCFVVQYILYSNKYEYAASFMNDAAAEEVEVNVQS